MIKSIREQSVLDKTYAKALPTAKSKNEKSYVGPPLRSRRDGVKVDPA